MGKVSIRLKMALWYGLLTAVLLACFFPVMYTSISRSMHDELKNELRAAAALITSDVEVEDNKYVKIEKDLELSPDILIRVSDMNGNKLYGSDEPPWMAEDEYSPDIFRTKKDGRHRWLVFDVGIENNGRNMAVAKVCKSLDSIDSYLLTIKLIMLMGAPVVLLIAVLGGLFIAGRALKPVAQITQTARQIEGGNLSKRITGIESKDEVGQLANTFNSMLEQLEISFKREQQFASDASHELKTPVAVILNYSEQLIKSAKRESESHTEEYHIINQESIKMNKIIAQLLSLTRGYEGKYELDMEHVNLYEIVVSVMEQLREYADQKEIRLLCRVHSEIYVDVDQSLWTQLFLNLIENAIKYGKQGGMVEVSAAVQDGFVHTYVKDDGIGIDEGDIPCLFDRFYRVDRSRDRTGTGLGLSIAKWIVNIHGASIEVESTPGAGTVFSIFMGK